MCRVKVYLKLINLSFDDKKIKYFMNNIINLRKKIYIANVDNCGCGIQRFIQASLGLEIIGGIMVLWATLLVLHGAGFVGKTCLFLNIFFFK